MSVINQMLQELEQNQSHSGSDPVSSAVRSVAESRRPVRVWRWLALAGVIVLTVAAVAWYWLAPQLWSPAQKRPAPTSRAGAAPPAAIALPPPPVAMAVPPVAAPKEKKAAQPVLKAAAPEEKEERQAGPEEKMTVSDEGVNGKRTKPKVVVSAKTSSGGKLVKQVTPQQQAEFLYQKAVALLQQGRTAEAEAGLGEVLKLDPDHQAARQLWVGLLLEQKQYILAEQLLQEGVLAHPERTAMAMTLARLQVEQGNERGGLETVERTLIRVPSNPDLHGFAAVLLQRMGRHGEAVNHFREALKAIPGSGNWWIGLGISLRAEKKLEEAEAAFRRANATEGLSPELQSFAEQQIRSIQHQPGK